MASRVVVRKSRLVGVFSLAAAVITLVLLISGIAVALGGDFATSTGIGYLAVGTSVAAVVGGLAALILGRGRLWGVIAIVLGLAANPLLLTRLLSWAGGLG